MGVFRTSQGYFQGLRWWSEGRSGIPTRTTTLRYRPHQNVVETVPGLEVESERDHKAEPWDRFVGHAVWHVQHGCVGSRKGDEMVLEQEQGVVGAYEANGRTSKSTAHSERETQIDSWHQASRPAG